MTKEESIKKIQGLCEELETIRYEQSKYGIFGYDTLDEVDSNYSCNERIRTDLTVEIGGPSTHLKFVIKTRAEHTKIKDIAQSILSNRQELIEMELAKICTEYSK